MRASQSEPICLSRACGPARRLLESARFAKRRANSNRYAAQRLPSSPINLTGNAHSVEGCANSQEVLFEEMMPKDVNQGARPEVISPKPVSGQPRRLSIWRSRVALELQQFR